MHTFTKHRARPSINASSMADVAFLLLAFFLVTATIDVEKGIRVKLASWQNEPPADVSARNILSVKINCNNELLVRGEAIGAGDLKRAVKTFILNPENDPGLPVSPRHAVIVLQNDRSTSYQTYLTVYNELKAAYNELWEELALKVYAQHFFELSRSKRKAIQQEIPLVISEGELVDLK